ncbi:MAG: hypothetical protein VB060_09305 [Oscillibacter sp.]|nr:hypothetical protein [Oscillibacter sp.]MEA4994011.1 hypothetical protein [Oscillibacter sp.]
MAKKNKAPEQDSAPAVILDADIVTGGQQTGQPEAPPFDTDTQPPEMTAEEADILTQEGEAALVEMGESLPDPGEVEGIEQEDSGEP